MDQEKINSINFNQDSGCFVVSTSFGIRIFNTDNFHSVFHRSFDGGVNNTSLYYRTNILAMVGTYENLQFSQKKVVLWDDHS